MRVNLKSLFSIQLRNKGRRWAKTTTI